MISYKAFKGGLCMIITNRINTHFTNLIGDENFANAYFLNKSIDDFSVERLHGLEKKYDSASKKYNFVAQILSDSKFVGIDSLIKKSALRLEKERKRLFSAKNELEVFESNLAYLILSEKIAFPDELGFSSEYVKELLTNKKKEVENSAVEYSYFRRRLVVSDQRQRYFCGFCSGDCPDLESFRAGDRAYSCQHRNVPAGIRQQSLCGMLR